MQASNPAPPRPPEPIVPPRRRPGLRQHLMLGLAWAAGLLFAAYLFTSFVHTDFNLYLLLEGADSAKSTLLELLHPDLSLVAKDRTGQVVLDPKTNRAKPGTLPVLLASMNETVEISLVGTFLSVIFSFPLAFFAARNLTRGSFAGRCAYSLTRAVFNVTRAFPPYILAIILVMIVGAGPFPGVLAIALHSIGMMGKLFAETIEGVDQAPVEAVRATGANNLLVVWYGILPQVTPQFLAFSLYRWDMNIRMAFILGIVGAGGIGFLLDQYIGLFQWDKASTVFIIILAAVTLLDWGSAFLREKLG
jgi:phosphonate transport system permease protein